MAREQRSRATFDFDSLEMINYSDIRVWFRMSIHDEAGQPPKIPNHVSIGRVPVIVRKNYEIKQHYQTMEYDLNKVLIAARDKLHLMFKNSLGSHDGAHEPKQNFDGSGIKRPLWRGDFREDSC